MSKNMKCNKQYLFHILHFYYDRHEQILTLSGHFGSIPLLPKCPAAEVSCCRSVRTPLCQAKPGFSYLWRCTFSPKKLTTFFSRRLRLSVHWRTLNVHFKRQNSGVKMTSDRRGPLGGGGPPMVQPAQSIIRPRRWKCERATKEIIDQPIVV